MGQGWKIVCKWIILESVFLFDGIVH